MYSSQNSLRSKAKIRICKRRLAPEGLIYVSSCFDGQLERYYQLMETPDSKLAKKIAPRL